MTFIAAGSCMKCGTYCFEVKQVWADGERYPGEPKRLGPPEEGAKRVTMLLLDGTRADVTLCANCELTAEDYTPVWQRILRTWRREQEKDKPQEPMPGWMVKQFDNGFLCEMGRTTWKELANG